MHEPRFGDGENRPAGQDEQILSVEAVGAVLTYFPDGHVRSGKQVYVLMEGWYELDPQGTPGKYEYSIQDVLIVTELIRAHWAKEKKKREPGSPVWYQNHSHSRSLVIVGCALTYFPAVHTLHGLQELCPSVSWYSLAPQGNSQGAQTERGAECPI